MIIFAHYPAMYTKIKIFSLKIHFFIFVKKVNTPSGIARVGQGTLNTSKFEISSSQCLIS